MNREEARKKAEALVAKMTVEEKAGQLKFDAPSIERLGIPAYNWWNEALHGVARAGTATVFPQAIALAAMFDDKKLKEIADVIRRRKSKVSCIFQGRGQGYLQRPYVLVSQCQYFQGSSMGKRT